MPKPPANEASEQLHHLSEQLREIEAHKAAVLESALDCIIIMDELGLIVEFNPAAEKTFGYRRDDVIGKAVADIVIPTHLRAAHWRGLEHYLKTGEGPVLRRRIEMPARRANGEEFPVELAIAVTRLHSGRVIFTAYVRDITERVRAAEALRHHHDQLEQAVAERTVELERTHQQMRWSERLAVMGTLAAGLGHDLGNLLLPMRIRLEAIKARTPIDDTALTEDIEALEKNVDYLRRLANGLRMLASSGSPESGARQKTNLHEWWADAESILRSVLPRGIRMEHQFQENLPEIGLAPPLLTHVVFNLVQNAADALRSETEGRIVIWAKTASDDDAEVGGSGSNATTGNLVLLGVTDNGPGMTAEVKERCRQPFFSTKPGNAEGGLGLALVMSIIEKAGGQVRIESESGRGATIILHLPLNKKK